MIAYYIFDDSILDPLKYYHQIHLVKGNKAMSTNYNNYNNNIKVKKPEVHDFYTLKLLRNGSVSAGVYPPLTTVWTKASSGQKSYTLLDDVDMKDALEKEVKDLFQDIMLKSFTMRIEIIDFIPACADFSYTIFVGDKTDRSKTITAQKKYKLSDVYDRADDFNLAFYAFKLCSAVNRFRFYADSEFRIKLNELREENNEEVDEDEDGDGFTIAEAVAEEI